MTVIYNMSIARADKPWIGDRRLTELGSLGETAEVPASTLASMRGSMVVHPPGVCVLHTRPTL